MNNESSKYKATCTWELANLQRNYHHPIYSPKFSPLNSQIKFNLKISSKASATFNNNLQNSEILLTLCMQNQSLEMFQAEAVFRSLNLRNVNVSSAIGYTSIAPSGPKLPVYYRISFLDSVGHKHHSQDGRAKFSSNTNSATMEEPIEGWEYRISYEYLREMYGQSSNSTIRILCEVVILKKFNEIESPFEQKWKNIAPQPKPEIEIQIPCSKANGALDHYQALLESGTLSDMVLVVGKKEFHVHKAILAARSTVFAAMFRNDLEEKLQNRVVIPDLDVEVCELLLPYIYTDKIPSMKEYALELFFASDKYQLDHLKSICEQNLIKTLSIQTVAHTLLLADMHSATYLKRKCVEYITRNSEQVMATKGWIEMTKARPELLMELYKDISAMANPLLKRSG